MKKLLMGLLILATNSLWAQPSDASIEQKVQTLLDQMTLEEKIGQMNQYNGFWNVTGPSPKNGDAAYKYQNLASGFVGSMLNVEG